MRKTKAMYYNQLNNHIPLNMSSDEFVNLSSGKRLRLRFLDKVKFENGHWIWVGGKKSGLYGSITYGGDSYPANRFSMYLFRGFSLFSNMQVNHKRECNNAACVNPDHLYIGTSKENRRDYVSTITHCPHGHEYTPENTRYNNGTRICKTCDRIYKSKHN